MPAKTRVGVGGAAGAYLGFTAKSFTAIPGYTPVHDLGTVIFVQVVTKLARID